MDVAVIIDKYYPSGSKARSLLVHHSRLVARKALDIAERVRTGNPDLDFIEEAALLHDIGIYLTRSPQLGCFGTHPYIAHGFLGRELLDKEGLPHHGLVCERHVGVGITVRDIIVRKLPLPLRDMSPVTIEEKIICFADKFFSKAGDAVTQERSVEAVRALIAPYGYDKVRVFDEWLTAFGEPR